MKIAYIIRGGLLLIAVLAAAVWFSAGCAGNAAPSGGGTSPVAVELPAATTFDQGLYDTLVAQ